VASLASGILSEKYNPDFQSMQHVGYVNAPFNVRPQNVEIIFDTVSQQQILSFGFMLQVSIPQMLQELMRFQQSDGVPSHPLAEKQAKPTTIMTSAPAEMNHRAVQPVAPVVMPQCASGCQITPKVASNPNPPPTWGAQPNTNAAAKSPTSCEPKDLAMMPTRNTGPAQLVMLRGPPAKQTPDSANLHQAVMKNDVVKVRELLQGFDVESLSKGWEGQSFLYSALEAGGHVDLMSMLIQAACDVNATSKDQRTPLHLALAQHATISPMAARLLISSRASLTLPDANNITPLDCVRNLAMRSNNSPSPNIRQLLHEMSKRPTVSIGVAEDEDVLGALFMPAQTDEVVFYTKTTLGVYNMISKRVSMKQKLTQLRVQSIVRSVTINPETGTLIVFLELAGASNPQNLVLLWPTGQLQGEEPLKLSVEGGRQEGDTSLPTVVCSASAKTPLILLTRICSGKVICWRVNAANSQLVSETTILAKGGPIAISGNGRWLAAVDKGQPGNEQIELWTFESSTNSVHRFPKMLLHLARRPTAMALIHQSDSQGCMLALVDEAPATSPPVPIEVLAISADGMTSSMYRVRPETHCKFVAFCHESPDYLLSTHEDGVVVLYNLPQGQLMLSHDDMRIRTASISADRTLIVTAVAECFRISKVLPATN